MSGIKMTSGYNFEGYDIVEYLGFVNGQIALSSNFLRDLSSNIVEWSAQESSAITSKLENSSENAIADLIKVAEQRGANAIIGVALNYTSFSNSSVGTVATGTAVRIEKKKNSSRVSSSTFFVSNYYNSKMPRPVEVAIVREDNNVRMATLFYNYGMNEIRAVRCDVELTNYFDEKILLQGIDFIFEKNSVLQLNSEFVECKLPAKAVDLIKNVKVYVKKYVTSKGVYLPDVESTDVEISKNALENLKEKKGKDAVERYKSDGTTWLCNCGFINAYGNDECEICGRKESEIRLNAGFDYEEMYNKMKEQPNVALMKDVLMDYIKRGAIDAKYRMELLETMESGLQYEKTRGDMKETVLDKVMKVFER